MTFAKVPLVCRDYAFSYEDMNQLKDNGDAVKAIVEAKHGTGRGASYWDGVGRHNDPLIPRALIRVELVTSVNTHFTNVYAVAQLLTPTCIRVTPRVTTTGQVTLAIGPFVSASETFYARAWPEATSGEIRFCDLAVFQGNATFPTSVTALLYEHDGTNFALANYNFNLLVWGPQSPP